MHLSSKKFPYENGGKCRYPAATNPIQNSSRRRRFLFLSSVVDIVLACRIGRFGLTAAVRCDLDEGRPTNDESNLRVHIARLRDAPNPLGVLASDIEAFTGRAPFKAG